MTTVTCDMTTVTCDMTTVTYDMTTVTCGTAFLLQLMLVLSMSLFVRREGFRKKRSQFGGTILT